MATYSYEDYKAQYESGQRKGKQERKVGYFSLPDDESSAIVRFDVSSVGDFQFADLHRVKIDKGYRNVACLRNAKEPLAKCPLCAEGVQRSAKVFVRLLEYTTGEDGSVKVEAKVWERPAYFAKTLETYINEYGDLRDCVFKVVRKGAKGEMKVNYELIYKNPAVYSEESGFKKDFSDFDDFELNHHSFMEKTAEDMVYFLEHGEFNYRKDSTETQKTIDVSEMEDDIVAHRVEEQAHAPTYTQQQSTYAPTQATTEARPTRVTQETADPTVARPRRTYDYR